MLPNYNDDPRKFYNTLATLTPEQLKSEWMLTTEEDYFDMLGCLPPIRWDKQAFMVGECMTHTKDGAIYEAFIRVNGKHYKRPALLRTFSPSDYMTEIASLNI